MAFITGLFYKLKCQNCGWSNVYTAIEEYTIMTCKDCHKPLKLIYDRERSEKELRDESDKFSNSFPNRVSSSC